MAFFNRVGSILKQSVSKHTNLELSASNASLFQAIRSMSSSKLFVGGLSYGTDESSLKEAFAQYGEVIEARVILDRDTGRSRGFGFISYPSSEEATSAMQAMDGQDLHGRQIRVNYATEKRRAGFGGGYGGGGYGGGGYGGEGGNFGGGGGYATNNYGGGGGYGNSSGFNYGGEGGNVAGSGGGYTANNYNSSAGGYGGYGGGGNYGNDNNYPVQGGNTGGGVGYGGGNYGSTPNSSSYGAQGGSFSGGNGDGSTSAGYGGSFGASYNADQETQPVNEDLGQEASEGNYRDEDDEPKDYANTRG